METIGLNDSKENKKKVFKAGIVDVSKIAEAQARDVADSRMTETKEDRSKNWLVRTGKRIWKHNLAQEWYRQREIGRARKEISESGNLYGGESNDANIKDYEKAKLAIIERFTSEYEDEMLKQEEKDSKKSVTDEKVKLAIKDLIKEFAGDPTMSEVAFKEEQKRILHESDPEYVEKGKLYADNLLDIAREIKNSVSHGEKLTEMDFDVEITLGKARESLNTEAKHNAFEKVVEKTQNSKLGKYLFNEPVAVSIAAGLYSAGNFLGMKMLRSKIVQWGTFGATALLAGGVSSVKEAARLNRERSQHMRESAKGMEFKEDDMKRRQEMEENKYETKNASEIIQNLEKDLAKISTGNIKESDLNTVLVNLSDIETRVKLGEQRKLDLVAYSRFDQVEKERMTLDSCRAKLKVMIRKGIEEGRIEFTKENNFDNYLKQLIDTQSGDLAGEIEKKDEIFKTMKRKKVAGAFIKTALIGASVGFAFQEISAAFQSGGNDGIIEGAIKGGHAPHATAFEGLRRWIAGDNPRLPFGNGHEMVLGNTHMQLPEGVEIIKNPDGTFDVLRGNDVISDNVKLEFAPNNDLTETSKELLAKDDILTNFSQTGGKITEHVTRNAQEYVNKHPEMTEHIHRSWMDNDTPMYPDPDHPGHLLGADKNELKLEWGGKDGKGLTENGDYVFQVQHMTNDGSFHEGLSVAAQDQMKHGGLDVLLSVTRGTQQMIIPVHVDEFGKAVIDHTSDNGKMLFENVNGHAVFEGAFAEVGHPTGLAGNSGQNMQILATHIGTDHVNEITETIVRDTTISNVGLNVPADWDYDVPPFIPIGARRPLERGEYIPDTSPVVPYYYSGSNVEEIQKEFKEHGIEQDPYTMVTSENGNRIWVDKNGKEIKRDIGREKDRIKSYLGKQSKEYLEELQNFNKNLKPMSENCRVSVIIPARFEEKNLKNLLDQYTQQVDEKGNPVDKDFFEINIIINRKEGEEADKSMEIIKEWNNTNPGYHVNAVDVIFSKKNTNVGMARKYITDLSLLRSIERKKSNGSLYIESEDADLFSVDKRTVNKLTSDFDKKPYLDVLRGIQDRQPEIMSKNDLLFFERRLWDIGEMTMRDLSLRPDKYNNSSFTWNRIVSGGWNTAYTAEAYAQIGGYVSDVIGEDMKIGQKISVLRGGTKDNKFKINTYTAETSGLRSNSSPRRFIDAMIKQGNPYDNFEDQSIKHKTLEQLMDGIKQFKKISPEHKRRYELGINVLYRFMKDEMGTGKETKRIIEKTLFYLGLKQGQKFDYVLNKQDTIKITDIGYKKIGELLSKYKDEKRWELGYHRQNSSNKMVSKENQKVEYAAEMKELREKLKQPEIKNNEEKFLEVENEIRMLEKKEKNEKSENKIKEEMSEKDFKEEMYKTFTEILKEKGQATIEKDKFDIYIKDNKIIGHAELKANKKAGGTPIVDIELIVKDNKLVFNSKPRIKANILATGSVSNAMSGIPTKVVETLEKKYKKIIDSIKIEDSKLLLEFKE